MATQIQNPVIVLYDHHEKKIEHGKEYLHVFNYDGTVHKISEVRRALWDLFDDAVKNKPYIFVYQEVSKEGRKIPYVADVKLLADELTARAVKDLGIKLADQATEERNRSQSYSYTKDLICAGKLDISEEFTHSVLVWQFIKTGKTEEEVEGRNG